ncbi:glycosyltransferase family 1 protein [Sodalis sp. dw_96]|uniref:glycosyltransferase family 4 protein n=1 Tax=Sodalis sp. dw_96 TaxID=2719794 RepID=UPI001BD2C0B1|nr:glycosyltransferase family 1 protein [Sodalis sp. dw_96]
MNKKIVFDNRWQGFGGIGTFSNEIFKIAKYKSANFAGDPISPLDPFKTSIKIPFVPADFIFFPGYIPPFFSSKPYAFTIHDLNHLDRPENSSILKKLFYNLFIKRGCKKAQLIFTVSDFSRQKIISWAGIDPNKIVNVGNGVSPAFNLKVTLHRFEYDYVLCVSNRKIHKNEQRTICAFVEANLPNGIKLVFTGEKTEELELLINELDAEDKVVFTGFVKEDELPALYKGALVLIFVSLYEGFGLPVIEAMACGTPVITSNTSSLPEIAGDAAILVDPEDTKEIALSLNRVIDDDVLRATMIKKGIKQAEKFTWDITAKKIETSIEQVLFGIKNGRN